jgi:hypothetical protein
VATKPEQDDRPESAWHAAAIPGEALLEYVVAKARLATESGELLGGKDAHSRRVSQETPEV